ncbi:regulatory protein RecX [Dokdonella sp.]|uniref:regulatory protein RecX n=1 Tax=Dokdonella sp. TaxID=2291710 RepID=UPI003C591C1B
MSRKPPGKPRSEKPSAYNKALGLLTRREQSERELKAKLARGGYSGEESSEAIDALKKQKYQSDSRFAEMLARSRAANGYGPRRIAAELKSQGVDDSAARSAIDGLECDWTDLGRQQLQRHYGSKPAADLKERGKRAAFLLRRGFDASTVSALTRAEIGDPGDEFD